MERCVHSCSVVTIVRGLRCTLRFIYLHSNQSDVHLKECIMLFVNRIYNSHTTYKDTDISHGYLAKCNFLETYRRCQGIAIESFKWATYILSTYSESRTWGYCTVDEFFSRLFFDVGELHKQANKERDCAFVIWQNRNRTCLQKFNTVSNSSLKCYNAFNAFKNRNEPRYLFSSWTLVSSEIL